MLNCESFVYATHDVMLLSVAISARFGRSARIALPVESGHHSIVGIGRISSMFEINNTSILVEDAANQYGTPFCYLIVSIAHSPVCVGSSSYP